MTSPKVSLLSHKSTTRKKSSNLRRLRQSHPSPTALSPHRDSLSQEDCDHNPDHAFHPRYRRIVGSLGYHVKMTRPDLTFAYSEWSKYVQYPAYPGKSHMKAANLVLRHTPLSYGFYHYVQWGPTIGISRHQDSVALSTSEADCMAASPH